MIDVQPYHSPHKRRLLTVFALLTLLLSLFSSGAGMGAAQEASPEPIVTETEAPTIAPTEPPTGTPTEAATLAPTSTATKASGGAQTRAAGDMPCPDGYDQLIANGSFETPVMAEDGWQGVNSGQASWYTVSTGSLEWLRNWGGLPAAHGTQYTEVNTGSADTIYQTVSTTPGETLNISFYHSARNGESDNQMRVSAGPNTGSLTQLGDTIETDGAWVLYTREYLVPAGQTSTVFAFEAVYPTGNAGNLVDGVSACEGDPYTPTPIPPSPTPTPVPAYMTCPTGYTQILTNGSFETPDQGRDSWGHYDVSEAQGWESTEGKVEYLTNSEFMQGIDPPDGDQWMELHVTSASTMYRSLTTTPGNSLIITFYHSSRASGETNIASVELGPTLAEVESVGLATSGYGWEQEEFTYLIPAGQTTTVFALVPVQPDAGNSGNEIDAVGICEGPPLPTATPTATSTPTSTATATPTETSTATATPAGPPVELHFRACPAGATDAFRDCHDVGVPDLDGFLGGAPCTTDDDGDCQFDASGGDLTIEWDSPAPASLIFCSVPSNRGVNLWDDASNTVSTSGAEPITCDIYLMQSPPPPPPADPGVKLHFRACAPGATDFFRDCHDNPMPGMDAFLASFPCTTDDDGNCDFDEVPAGDHTITWDGDPALLVYCSDASDRSVNLWDDGSDTVPYTDGADITCDIFILDPGLVPPTPQPTPTSVTVTDLPNTGAGILSGGGALGVGIAMIAALIAVLGALGLAARRAGISHRA